MGRKTHKKSLTPPGASYGAKQWNPVFFTKRKLKDEPFIDTRDEMEADGDHLRLFVGNYEHTVQWWEAEMIENYCRAVQNKKAGRPIQQRRARVDDRERSTGRKRKYDKWLTSHDLRKALEFRRSGSSGLSDADRRLIYISHLTPDFIQALWETASCNEIEALRDAVAKHLSSETSIRVHNSLDGSMIFRLELHLPYLTLRESNEDYGYPAAENGGVSGREWIDIPFLEIEPAHDKPPCRYVIEKARLSIVFSGPDHFKWIGYAFVSASFDDEQEDDDDDDDDDFEGFEEDFFASVDAKESVLDANKPFWDPRVYWLRVTDFRLGVMVEESTLLVMKIVQSVKSWRAKNSFTLTDGLPYRMRGDIQYTFDRLIHIIELLRTLCDSFSATIDAGEMFNGPGGDREYFADMKNHQARISLNNIEESFAKLEALQRKLLALDISCKRSAEILGLRISLENNQLSSKNNKINVEASEHAHQAAKRMHNTTSMSLQIVLSTTPVALALQVFGSEREIFPFERNTKSFYVFTIISWIALQLLMFFLSRLDRIKAAVIWNFLARVFRQDNARNIEEAHDFYAPREQV